MRSSDASRAASQFVNGVPVDARALLLVVPVSGVMALAALIAAFVDVRAPRTSPSRFADCVVFAALLSFVAFAWYWNLMPPVRE